jgi:PIN domain nuclease of toxin-antitoxin system
LRLLLDTHVWLWASDQPTKLSKTVLTRLRDARNERWVSPLSYWELLLMSREGRLSKIPSLQAWFEESKRNMHLRIADLTFAVVEEAATFRLPHGDPADNLLVATARHYKLTFVTADQRIIDSGSVDILAGR